MRSLEWHEESRADCQNCVMLPHRSGEDPRRPWAYNPQTRCCTYHPSVPNFLAGRALLRKDAGAARLMVRLRDHRGVTSWGIHPSEEYRTHYRDREEGEFGRNLALRCPFWVGGPHSCGIWRDRPAVCRTWYCKHEGGQPAHHAWMGLRYAVEYANRSLALWLAVMGKPPPIDSEPIVWARWYVWCWHRVERTTPDELEPLRTTSLDYYRRKLREAHAVALSPFGDFLVPAPKKWLVVGDRTRLTAYSRLDAVWAPKTVFGFFNRLDGRTPWKQAMDEANVESDLAPVTAPMVREMYRVGVLRKVTPGDLRSPAGSIDELLPESGEARDFVEARMHGVPEL